MLPFYHILILVGVILWDFATVGVAIWLSLRRHQPKLLKGPRKRKFGRDDSQDIVSVYSDLW